MNSRILLTGASGFIGRHLLRDENVVRCVSRKAINFSGKPTFIIDELSKETDWNGAFESIDSVVHLAGIAHSDSYSFDDYNRINCNASIHLAKEAFRQGVKRFVFVSSIGVNGLSSKDRAFTFDGPLCPHSDYSKSKCNTELGLKELSDKTGLELVIVRPTLVYGVGAPGNFSKLVKLVKLLPVLPFGLTSNKRDFISVENLADLLVVCANHPDAAGHTFLASDSETVSIKEFTNAIAKGVGKKVLQVPIPVWLMNILGNVAGKSSKFEQLFGNLEVDSSNVKEVLNWTPPYSMMDTMAKLRVREKDKNDSFN